MCCEPSQLCYDEDLPTDTVERLRAMGIGNAHQLAAAPDGAALPDGAAEGVDPAREASLERVVLSIVGGDAGCAVFAPHPAPTRIIFMTSVGNPYGRKRTAVESDSAALVYRRGRSHGRTGCGCWRW